MARKIAQGSITARQRIINRQDFDTYGNLSGSAYDGGVSPWDYARLTGSAQDRFRADAPAIDYVVKSYATPIAWHTPAGWVYVGRSFSHSTANAQAFTRYALGSLPSGYETIQPNIHLTPAQLSAVYAARIAPDGMGGTITNGREARTAAILAAKGVVSLTPNSNRFTLTTAGEDIFS